MAYIIPDKAKASPTESKRVMAALMGRTGQGKTYGALTFPNPVVANFDDNLQAHEARIKKGEIQVIPFHDASFCDSLVKRTISTPSDPKCRPNKRDAFTKWLGEHGYKLEGDQTLILDSWTTLQDAFDLQQDLEPFYTAGGKVDDFAFWGAKQDYSKEVLNILKSLKCNVVVTFHEQMVTDEGGKVVLNKVNPLMQGKFVNRLGLYFAEWYRCYFYAKGTKLPEAMWKCLNLTSEVTPEDIGIWQTKSDTIADCKSRMFGAPQFIKAHYNSIQY